MSDFLPAPCLFLVFDNMYLEDLIRVNEIHPNFRDVREWALRKRRAVTLLMDNRPGTANMIVDSRYNNFQANPREVRAWMENLVRQLCYNTLYCPRLPQARLDFLHNTFPNLTSLQIANSAVSTATLTRMAALFRHLQTRRLPNTAINLRELKLFFAFEPNTDLHVLSVVMLVDSILRFTFLQALVISGTNSPRIFRDMLVATLIPQLHDLTNLRQFYMEFNYPDTGLSDTRYFFRLVLISSPQSLQPTTLRPVTNQPRSIRPRSFQFRF